MYIGREAELNFSDESNSAPIEDSAGKVRLLALHGSGSNSDVTKMQLENLGLTTSEYDVTYVNGPILVDDPGLGMAELAGLISGPWYSWLPREAGTGALEGDLLLDAICDAVQVVLSVIERDGPFDGVFGFSQGAVIASLVNGLLQDKALLTALRERAGALTLDASKRVVLFESAIFACAAAPLSLSALRLKAGLGDGPDSAFNIQSVHFIGRQDEYKGWSESFAQSFLASSTYIHYFDDGHEISRRHQGDSQVYALIHQCLHDVEENSEKSWFVPQELDWKRSSSISSLSVASDRQVAAVKLKTRGLVTSIFEMLDSHPADAPLFRLAREQDENVLTTYGQMLEFCRPQGQGDLRRLDVQHGDVVAYLAPPGGSAVAATAFLSIAAQACAVPFAANMSETDALLALEQYGVKHMIVFEGVAGRGVRTAFEDYASKGSARLHHAAHLNMPSPGLFRYLNPKEHYQQLQELINPPSGNSLLLRTSGTTSVPKVVPLRQQDLVLNAAILAEGIGITAADITYSIMPLDHIGGISASILCSVAVGASVTCDGQYNPHSMVEALLESNPRPTWYSAVPTIHNATVRYLQEKSEIYIGPNGKWHGHNLRMVRSGAAALKEYDRSLIEVTFGCDVVPTYSMSELMPISQPPQSEIGWYQHPGSVGVPVAASMAVVDPETLRPLPFASRGEIAISGPTVFSGYLHNPDANRRSRFLMKSHVDNDYQDWFLTGDLGEMDRHGVLTLRGRIKELIKRGGEQVAPAEVESILTQHSSVSLAVCFAVPSDAYGEEVGCALILEPSVADQTNLQDVIAEMRSLLREEGLAAYKVPSVWTLAASDDIPRTASKKIIRNGLADVLGVSTGAIEQASGRGSQGVEDTVCRHSAVSTNRSQTGATDVGGFDASAPLAAASVHDKPQVDWATLAGFRFVLACYVMFMHIGSNESWDAFSNLRQFPWHVHAFFTLAGFTLAIIMPSMITRKLSFVTARVSGMYPLYGLAVLLALGNLLVSCQPSTFSSVFNWSPLLSNHDQMFCQGTPLVQDSWLTNVLLTLGIHVTGLQATPLWGASWFMGFYLWFISMYFQCLIVFPFLYNALYKNRGNTKRLLSLTILGLVVNLGIVLAFWYGYAVDATGYGLFDPLTGQKVTPTAAQVEAASQDNAVILGFYLFAPFWMVYFVAGMCAAFLYDAMRPSEQRRAQIWGYVADAITVFMIGVSVAHVAQGYFPYGAGVTEVSLDAFFMRPEAANSYADPSTVNRIWDNIYGRLFAPITLLWIFALSTGQGVTASVLRFSPLSQTLAPTAYACFLFHQIIGQWYFAATRNGEWWNWWSDQKTFYWFSPQPVAVEWYEYFYVVGLVVLFSKMVQPLDPALRRAFSISVSTIKTWCGVSDKSLQPKDTVTRITELVQSVTGMEAKPEWSLEECGLASLGIVQFVNTIETEFSPSDSQLRLSVEEIMSAQDIREIASIVDAGINESQSVTYEAGAAQMA